MNPQLIGAKAPTQATASASRGSQPAAHARLTNATLFYGPGTGAAGRTAASPADPNANDAPGHSAAPAAALSNVTLAIAPGEHVAVLGANGSGKSTLAQVLCGLIAPDQGKVELLGTPVCADGAADLAAYAKVRRHLGLVFQNPDDQIVTSVVADEVAFGPENLALPPQEIARRVQRELKRVALQDHAHDDPTRLSGGQKQRVCIAGALAMEPQLLVLDEPGALLDVRGRAAIMRVMARLKVTGTTLVHITHFMDEALAADRVIVMDHGSIALQGTPQEVFSANNFELIDRLGLEAPYEAKLGRELAAAGVTVTWSPGEKPLYEQLAALSADPAARPRATAAGAAAAGSAAPVPRPQTASAPELARIDNATFAYTDRACALHNVSLSIKTGTVTAVVGQTGSGKSTLVRLLCGLEAPDAGSVTVGGATTKTRRGRRAVRAQVGLVMQHPERQLFAKTVWEDVAFGPRNLGLSANEVNRHVEGALQLVGLAHRADASPFALSGGQRRLAALAGVLAMQPKLLVLDEPTAGLDPRGRRLVRDVLARLAAAGTTLVQVTHSMEDAARADQVLVLNQSQVLMTGTPAEVFSPQNARRLAEVGLGLPRALDAALRLKDAGLSLPSTPLTTSELVRLVQQALSGEKPAPTAAPAASAPPTPAASPAPADPKETRHGL